ncbi:MAG: alpha/beta fold hydrolase [Opitutae bacterium]|nr:alpha/beta fold hydrolase [Opitutae bacterium]
MVHGIWDKGIVYQRMAKVLTDQGHNCHTPDLEPANGAYGLADLAEKLKVYIDQTIGSEAPFALIGFSMGTIIARYYLQILGGASRVSHFFSISGPLHGTLTAHFWPGKASRDMRFRSKLLQQLNADTSALAHTVIHSYRTPFDLLIIPTRSSYWKIAVDNHIVPALFHHRMLIHCKVYRHIAETLKASD